ncbi:MAG: LOG family protein [Sedimentisphaerales bacterium]|nr:LOG family protein [Sedimentisphaerales bacterium]
MSEKVVTIFGAGNAKPEDKAYKLAFETGSLLAEAGFTIANGGYGGSMLAAAQGAAKTGGKTIGVTCRKLASKPNKFISREITTDSLEQRLDTLVKLGQAYVVLPGATGTLLELAMVWELKNKGFLKPEKPIILLGGFWKPLLKMIAAEEPKVRQCIRITDSPEQVRDILVSSI